MWRSSGFSGLSCRVAACVVSYPSERNDVERVLSAVNGIQEVTVGDLRTRKHLQLTAGRRKNRFRLNVKPTKP